VGEEAGPDARAAAPRFTLSAAAGAGAPRFHGALEQQSGVEVPVTLNVVASGTACVWCGEPLALELGVQLSYVRLPYTTFPPAEARGSSWLGAFGLLGARLRVGERLSVAPLLGVGVVGWAGLGARNPFTAGAVAASGVVPMPSLRLTLPLRFAVTRRAFVELAPTYTRSQTTGDGLRARVRQVSQVSVTAGAGLSF
jgi:hypothetical protein